MGGLGGDGWGVERQDSTLNGHPSAALKPVMPNAHRHNPSSQPIPSTPMIRILLAVCCLLFSGCASQIQLSKEPYSKPPNVSVIDHRTPEKMARRHDALFSAVGFLEDTRFSPRALDIYASALSKAVNQSQQVKLEVDEFRIVDFYPVRLGAGGQGFLGTVIFEALTDKNTDWSFVNDMRLDRSSDAVACIVIGKLNGLPVKVAVSERYRASPFAGLVYNDPDFQRALSVVVNRAALESISQVSIPR